MNLCSLRLSGASARLGFWSACCSVLIMAIYIGCFFALMFAQPLFLWTTMADYIRYAQEHRSLLPDLARLTMLLFGSLFVILLSTIHDGARDGDKPFTRLGLCFGVAFAAITGAFYFVQITTVRFANIHGKLEGLDQIVQANPYSAWSAVNMLGWTLFLGLASLCAAQAFHHGRLEKVIRTALLVNGIVCFLGGIAYLLDIVVMIFLTVNLGMGGALTVAVVGLSLLFREQATAGLEVHEQAGRQQ